MGKTAISWTNQTWNPVHGCSHVSEGCRFCYAERLSRQKGFTDREWTKANAESVVRLQHHKLQEPLRMPEGCRVFVNSMSDLFHPLVPDSYLDRVFEVMSLRPDITFQVLTKRPERAASWGGPWTQNIWMGTSVELARHVDRIDDLRGCGARTKFVSAEPLLGDLGGLDLSGIDWVIVGGESGPHLADAERALRTGGDPCEVSERWMRQDWARSIRDQSVTQGCAFFFKQDAGIRTELRCYLVEDDGSRWRWHQYPGDLADPERIDVECAYA